MPPLPTATYPDLKVQCFIAENSPGALVGKFTTLRSDGTITFTDKGNGVVEIAGAAASTVTPGGANTDVQYNDSGSFGGDSGFVYDKATSIATLATALQVGSNGFASVGQLRFANGTAKAAMRNGLGTDDIVFLDTDATDLYLGSSNTGAKQTTNLQLTPSGAIKLNQNATLASGKTLSVLNASNSVASIGRIAFTNAQTLLAARNAADDANITVAEVTNNNDIYIGYGTDFVSGCRVLRLYARASDGAVALGINNGNYFLADASTTSNQSFVPIIGAFASQHGVHGKVDIPITGDTTVSDTDIGKYELKFTGTLGGTPATIILKSIAADDKAYTKFVWNASGAALTFNITGGAGTSITVADNKGAILAVHQGGVRRHTADVDPTT